MSINVYKINGSGLRIPTVSTDPTDLENGMMWYNSTANVFKKFENGTVTELSSGSAAADVTYDNAGSGLTATDVQNAIDEVNANNNATQADVNALITLSGVAALEVDLGSFTGITIPDDSDIKEALQALETSVETKASSSDVSEIDTNVNDLVTLSGVAENATTLGTFSGTIISDGESIKGALQDLETFIEALPDPITYAGTWDASSNTPTLANGIGTAGTLYQVSAAGTVDFGAGNISFEIGDKVVYNGSIWEKWDMTDAVTSVNGQAGVVVLDSDDIAEGSTNLYFDEALVLGTDIAGFSSGAGTVTTADTILSALGKLDGNTAAKLDAVEDDAAPTLGGDLTVGDNVLLHGANGLRKGTSDTDFFEEEYIHSMTLTASVSNTVATDLTFAFADFEAVIIEYKIKEATTNRVRTGQLYISTNGTDTSIVDTFAETGDVGVAWDLNISTGDVQVRYSTTANAKTMRAIVKRIKT